MHRIFSVVLSSAVVFSLYLFPAMSQSQAAGESKGVGQSPTETKTKVKTLTWSGCGISKKAFMKELAKAFEARTGVKIKLSGGGATKGIRNVASRKLDLGGACRHTIENPVNLSPHPLERRVRMIPVAWDALVVIVHKSNKVENISLDQIRKIFTGKITNWNQLSGGRNAPIELYVRKGKISGVGRTVRELIFANYNQKFVARHVEKSSGPIERAIQGDAVNGIAITGISSARKRKGKIKILNLEGKEPSFANIKSGEYLLYRPLYIVTHLQNSDPDVKAFVRFVHSEEARLIMRKVGTVPYTDAIHLWLKYIGQLQTALAKGLTQ